MKTMFSSLVALSLFLSLAGSATSSERDEEVAIQTFDLLLTEGTNDEVAAQIESLAEAGFTVRGSTDAVVLSGLCGFAGCSTTYLVTTSFATRGANTRTNVIAAIVYVGPIGREATVSKILTREELASLLGH